MTICDRNGQQLLQCRDDARNFDGLNLLDAIFAGFELEGVGFDSSNLARADFTKSDLYWARFYDVNCSGACFKGASLRGASLYNSNFATADFTDADLSRDNLDGMASFEGINLAHATFVGANLSGATFVGVSFSGSTYDGRTIFPEGFDPDAEGMIRVEG